MRVNMVNYEDVCYRQHELGNGDDNEFDAVIELLAIIWDMDRAEDYSLEHYIERHKRSYDSTMILRYGLNCVKPVLEKWMQIIARTESEGFPEQPSGYQ